MVCQSRKVLYNAWGIKRNCLMYAETHKRRESTSDERGGRRRKDSSVNKLNVILLFEQRRKEKDILLEAICLSHEQTFFSVAFPSHCFFHSVARRRQTHFILGEQCHQVHIYNVLKSSVCLRQRPALCKLVMNICAVTFFICREWLSS